MNVRRGKIEHEHRVQRCRALTDGIRCCTGLPGQRPYRIEESLSAEIGLTIESLI